MIRLGTLAGYAFEGPRVLAGFTPPERPVVYVVLYRPDPASERYGVIFVGHTDDMSAEKLPFRHPQAGCWLRRVDGDKFKLHVAYLEAPGAEAGHREQIAQELIAIYKPGCNPDQYDQAWEEHWIGEYDAPTTAPLSTDRQPE